MDLDPSGALMAPFVSVGTSLPRVMSMHEDYYEETYEGVKQGGPLSPLLGNILLNDLDRELESRGHKLVRYADDMALLRLMVNTVMSFSAGSYYYVESW